VILSLWSVNLTLDIVESGQKQRIPCSIEAISETNDDRKKDSIWQGDRRNYIMERKTIGGFIAALRKANGMTQKELAEKLNVSDKTVSRWERDDGAPDLSVIPTIAEIFGVTCDELLRGERKPMDQQMSSPKAEKQRQRILTISMSKYKTRSFIAMGIAVVGLIAAMIGNFGFLRAYIGFLIGAIFYLASVVCQAIFVNQAFLAVSEESLVTSQEAGRFRHGVIRVAEWSIGLTVVLFGASLPLVIFAYDTYMGLTAQTWLVQGLAYGVVAWIIVRVCCYYLNVGLLKSGVYSLDAKEEEVYWVNYKLKKKYVFRTVLVFLLTWLCQFMVLTKWGVSDLSDSTDFYDYESFVEYMEQRVPYEYYSDGITAVEPVQHPAGQEGITYYDQFGNVISEEEALREELTDHDGKVLCTYIKRNQSVVMVEVGDGKDVFPIRTVNQEQWRSGRARYQVIQTAFWVVYGLEIVGAVLLYYRKRAK